MTTSLAAAGQRITRARAALKAAMATAEGEALKAIASGATEAEVARILGVDRMTVRKWAGKR